MNIKYKAIIFDLDQTLVDSSKIEPLRKSRQWPKVMQSFQEITQLLEIKDLISTLIKGNIKVGIITNSPRMYAEAVLKHFEIPYNALIAYHDVRYRKPHPEAFEKILAMLGVECKDCLSVGDHDNDIIASQSANVTAAGVYWYPSEYRFNSKPQFIFNTVDDLLTHLKN